MAYRRLGVWACARKGDESTIVHLYSFAPPALGRLIIAHTPTRRHAHPPARRHASLVFRFRAGLTGFEFRDQRPRR